jgi:hypothetical protein
MRGHSYPILSDDHVPVSFMTDYLRHRNCLKDPETIRRPFPTDTVVLQRVFSGAQTSSGGAQTSSGVTHGSSGGAQTSQTSSGGAHGSSGVTHGSSGVTHGSSGGAHGSCAQTSSRGAWSVHGT